MLAPMTALVPRAAAAVAALLAALAPRAPQDAPEGAPGAALTLPPSAAADALAAIADDVAALPLPPQAWPEWPGAGWEEAAPWQRWSELVLEEAEADRPDAGRRADLALCAAMQGRHVDAWDHFAAAARAEPGIALALLPRLVPGVPTTVGSDGGAATDGLPDGVLLRPALPPLDRESPYGRPRVRGMTLAGVRIGAATCDMTVQVEADGVEVSFVHRAGGPARVRVEMPIPHDRVVRSLYVDWSRSEVITTVVELELVPSVDGTESEAAAWARFVPRRLSWPAPGELLAPAQVRRAGLALVRADGDPMAARIDRVADALGVVLGVPSAGFAVAPVPPGATAPLPVAFRLDAEDDVREAKLAFLVSAAERFRLR
jgi:hypothetical protein